MYIFKCIVRKLGHILHILSDANQLIKSLMYIFKYNNLIIVQCCMWEAHWWAPVVGLVYGTNCKKLLNIIIFPQLSSLFQILNGTRHGCPISPLLFVLVIETLIQTIWQHPKIKGIETKNIQCKTAVFVDNLSIIMSEPTIEIPAIINIFDQFGKLFNFRINLHESEVLGITIGQPQIEHLLQKFLFK